MDSSQIIMWSPGVKLDEIERMVILKAYSFFAKNKTATANALGIAIRTLDNKLERYEQEEKILQDQRLKESQARQDLLLKARGNPPNNIGLAYSPYQNQTQPQAAILNSTTQVAESPSKHKGKK